MDTIQPAILFQLHDALDQRRLQLQAQSPERAVVDRRDLDLLRTPGCVIALDLVVDRFRDLLDENVRRRDFSLQGVGRSEEHTSELQSPYDLVCRLLLEKKKNKTNITIL